MTQATKPDLALERIQQGLAAAQINWQALLSMIAKFPRYSFTNVLLILMQCPNASLVQGFNSWKALNRFVKKGEKGIQIFAPRLGKDDQGNSEIKGFMSVYVFDVSQTDGDPLPAMPTPASDGTDQTAQVLFDTLKTWLLEEKACPVTFSQAPQGAAHYRRDSHHIEIKPNLGDIHNFGSLTHEAAHALLHHKDADLENIPRETRELEAESVTLIVCEHFSIPRASGFDYLAQWQATHEEIKTHGERITKTAKTIIKALTPETTEATE